MKRHEAQEAFVARSGWGDATAKPLAGDASNRRYERLMRSDGSCVVLMDAPPEKGEYVTPFIEIAEYLCGIGLSAPQIIAKDPSLGFLLIEDLGDRLYAREVMRDPVLEQPLYEAATDVLCHLHSYPAPDLKAYASDVTVPLAALAFDWYQAGVTGAVDPVKRSDFCNALSQHLGVYDKYLSVLIQRDYHAENLLWLPDRHGVARVGLLDFQDAMLGHPAYDLVSVLQDARRDVPGEIEQMMISRYVEKTGQDTDEFNAAYALFGLQRNMRILGVFTRLCLRDSKAHYLDLIPRVWTHIETNLRHPSLADLVPVVTSGLRAPNPAILDTLKEKCGSCHSQ